MQLNPQQTSRSHFKLDQGDLNSIHNNPLNTSTSKMQYSIPRSKRWSEEQSGTQTATFYNLPQLKSYGSKIDISKKAVITPAPTNYYVPGQFDLLKRKKVGITMGSGRETIKNVSIFGHQSLHKLPGPGNYEVKYSIIQNSPKYSFKSRHQDTGEKWIKSVPGPGNYSTIELVRNNSKISVSKFESSPSTSFSRNKRTSDYQEKLRILKVPGPGQYNSERESTLASKFYINSGRKFGKSQRKGIVEKSITPGPGAYKHFSDFLY